MWIFGWKGASGFSACSTAEEVAKDIDASALTAIVTGASIGIGVETARVLALCGAHVIMAVRNVKSGEKVRETILKEIPNAKIDVMELDLSSMASVRKFATEYNSSGLPLNLLINNAGLVIARKKEGLSMSHQKVIGSLTAKESVLTKLTMLQGNLAASYNTLYAYGQSKLANILHANELARRLKEEGVQITANSLHPGAIATNLTRHNSFVDCVVSCVGKYILKTIPQGAATTCYVALHPQVKGVSGEYFADSNIAKPSAFARDAELAKKLWDYSLNITDSK